MSMPPRVFSEDLEAICRTALQNLAAVCTGLRFASICTKDGFELVRHGGATNTKLSVMAGTMYALADSIVEEAGLNAGRNVIIEAEGGKAVIVSLDGLPEPLVLMGIAGNGETLGLLLHCCKNCCEEIASHVKSNLLRH